jgi:transcriptional regulator with PAS, ATPase and Fis domain
LAKVLRTGQPVLGVRTKSPGSAREVIANATPVLYDGKMVGAVVVIRDVSEVLRLAHQMEQVSTTLESWCGRVGKARHHFEDILGTSRALKETIALAKRIASADTTVLITGETGTGKELFAQAIHAASPRSAQPFIAVNCCALPPSLVESELFGHEKGAFTGAVQKRLGLFELAQDGTVFLDEIADLPFEMQGKLLRVLQEGEFRRVGGSTLVRTRARVIAATNKDIEGLVSSGKFRADLYYRLNVARLHLPPLRERREDIPVLVEHILRKTTQGTGKKVMLTERAVELLMQYHWPGNVRELENVLERIATIVTEDEPVSADLVGALLWPSPQFVQPTQSATSPRVRPLRELELEAIRNALAVFGKTVTGKRAAAKALGISLSTLYTKLKQLP